MYWCIPLFYILLDRSRAALRRIDNSAGYFYIVMARVLLLISLITTITEGIIFANRPYHPAKIEPGSWRRLIHKDLNHIQDMRTSLHFTNRTTLVLFAICSPLTIIFLVTPRYNLFGASCILAAAILGNLALRWLIELWALIFRRIPFWFVNPAYTFDGVVSAGNKDLDTCFERVYHQSTLTKWLVWFFFLPRRFWIERRPWLRGTPYRSPW